MEKLGIQVPLLLTQIVNFTLMVVILTKLLYKPILKGLKERRKAIEAGLKAAEKARTEEEKLAQKRQELLKETQAEARVILENAKKEGKRLKEELLAEGKEELVKTKVKMEKELQSKFEDPSAQVVAQTVDIVLAIVKMLIPEVIDTPKQHEIIKKQLKELEKRYGKH